MTTTPALALLQAMRLLGERGLNVGAAGNASVRAAEGLLITPSAVPVEQLSPGLMVRLGAQGEVLTPAGGRPSSEWRLHRDIYAARPEVGAIVHTHSPAATGIACARRDIPPFHYMVARLGGSDVRCGRYATFGTQALSDAAVAALAGRRACLLANHGQVALGRDLTEALATALELEALAEHYLLALAAGGAVLLSAAEMEEALARFADYRPGLIEPAG
jgi:L-fuculose-phosphate aldolase